ncbi:WhiB family transcriptional regulator [Actinoplanes sp. NPDC089786]|uniref:WhiB family transcriptional regulator n=1 Tax=Actinoplanes sp. NPDC089786 TaxID=3155185 RepID=UPI00342DE0F1
MTSDTSTTQDHLFPLHAAIGTPPAGKSCGRLANGFPDLAIQQAVFDGDVEDPQLLDAARAVCASCPVLGDCRLYAEDSLDDTTFLAGATATERRRLHGRAARARHRKQVVTSMRAAGITIPEISFYSGYPIRTIEADLARQARDGGI